MPYLEMSQFLLALQGAAPEKVQTVTENRRTIEHGLLSVGVKLHCLKGGETFEALTETLGGRGDVLRVNAYRRTAGAECLVLPPVGSARCAVTLIECIEDFTGNKIFNNRDVQIQVCTPGRLRNREAGLLTLAFYLGSDFVRGYDLDQLETTFSDPGIWGVTAGGSIPRGRRITIYDGRGTLDKRFEYWAWRRRRAKRGVRQRVRTVREELPFKHERTDVLTCTSKIDLYNVNLVATLLVHHQQRWYWRSLGEQFIRDLTDLFAEHDLMNFLETPWVSYDDATPETDVQFREAMREIMAYALEEVSRMNLKGVRNGILYQMNDMMSYYRHLVVAKTTTKDREHP